MRKLLSSALRSGILALAMLCAQAAHGEENAFALWWPKFQAAAAHDDKVALAAMMRFPLEWENLEIRSIASREDFLARFPLIFTADIKKVIAHAKPTKESGGYSVDWKGRGKRAANSYSLAFKAAEGGQFMIDGLYEGPRD